MGSPSHPPGRSQGDGPPARITPPSTASSWSLRWRERSVVLGDLPTVIGRSSQCDVLIEDALVSRRHAMLQVSGEELFLEDLRSANGVFVNGERVRRPRRLLGGDRLLIGNEEFVVVAGQDAATVPDGFQDEPRTLDPEARSDVHDVVAPKASAPARGAGPGATTEKAEAFTMLGKLADRLLAEGQPERAVRVMSDLLREVLDGARKGRDLPEETYVQACDYAKKLASATADGRWVDYQVELHLALKRPLSAALVEHVDSALAGGIEVDVGLFERYQAQIREIRLLAKPAERALCELSLRINPRPR